MNLKHIVAASRHYGRVRAFNRGKSLHAHLIKLGYSEDVFVANNLLSMYADFTLMDDAQNMFEEMPERNVVTWTTMISWHTAAGSPAEALSLFNSMWDSGSEVRPNSFTFSAALKACALLGDTKVGKLIHRNVLRENLQHDVVLMNTLLEMYVKCGSLADAQQVFDNISETNSTSWNTIISGYAKKGLMREAVNLFHRMPEPDIVSWNTIISGFALSDSEEAIEFARTMHSKGVKLDEFTFPCVLKTCGSLNMLSTGKQIHCLVVKCGFTYGIFPLSALVDMYAKCSLIDDAWALFDEISSYCEGTTYDNLVLWNSMLSGYVVNELHGAALELVSQIHRSGSLLDAYTFSSGLKVCNSLLHWRHGLQIHGLIVASGYELDCNVGSILIDFYAKHGDLKTALEVFHKLSVKDIITWAAMISSCTQLGSYHLAFSLFTYMVYLGLEIDQFVCSSVLKACSCLVALESGQLVHAFCIKRGYGFEKITVTSLIDMYAKCGEIECALTLFNAASVKDTISWTGIIVGCGLNGRAKEALTFFHEMQKLGFKPNKITFLGVLAACAHAGFVEEALVLFRCMRTKYELEPTLEHYCCMVALLGRSGSFKEAELLIADLPSKLDWTILSSLLWASGVHNNEELCKRISSYVLSISPGDPSIYVTLSNAHAVMGMWDMTTRLREIIKEVGMKEIGRSWIEVSR